MSIGTTKIILIAIGISIVLFAALGIYPLFGEIKEAPRNFMLHKKERAELAGRTESLAVEREVPLSYPFVEAVEMFDFIDFLKKEAESSDFSIEVISAASKKKDVWSPADFKLNLEGPTLGFLSFLEKIEAADYLIIISDLNLSRGEENIIKGSLSGEAYGRVVRQ